jgi:L-ectoine synthase
LLPLWAIIQYARWRKAFLLSHYVGADTNAEIIERKIMIVRNLSEAKTQGRTVSAEGWDSTRLLLKNDQAGFSFHITTIHKDAELHLHYQNHIESVYCISGKGEIEDLATGKVHPIAPGTIYILDKNDKHILRGFEQMEMACVFNPPLIGNEVHNAEGAYALEADELQTEAVI